MSEKYEVQVSEKLGRYLVAATDIKAGETILSDKPFVLGPNSDTSLVCFNCYLPLISKFFVCKYCAVAPICPGDGCPEQLSKFFTSQQESIIGHDALPLQVELVAALARRVDDHRIKHFGHFTLLPVSSLEWHSQSECDFFRTLKLTKGLNPMTMVQNVGSLLVLRVVLKKDFDKTAWEEFMQLETHLDVRRNTSVWKFCENTAKFIRSLGLLEDIDDADLIQKICAAIDVNSFEVRGPPIPAIGCSELLRGVYLKAALMAHDCLSNTHVAINDKNVLVCHASTDIKKGEAIYYNYTDPLKGTTLRQQHLEVGKYFRCSCKRCQDVTEIGTYMSSALCPECKTGYISPSCNMWTCHSCNSKYQQFDIEHKIQCCSDKLAIINKKDEKELKEYIKNVSLVLAPNHYLLLEAKQRLAGVLRDAINREPRPTKKMMRRKIELCKELLLVLEKISPGICRIKAITLYELHCTMVQLAKKLFDGREINGSAYLDELQNAEKHLKKSIEMLLIEPGNSPEGELCSKALEEYRALKAAITGVLLGMQAEGKTYVSQTDKNSSISNVN